MIVLPLLVLVVGALLIFYGLVRAPRSPAAPPRAQRWAARRGVCLTERSLPYVDTYLANARALRFVCGAGGIILAVLVRYATGVETGGVVAAAGLAGYLVGSVWADVSLARVPASPTREASLVVRDPRRYRMRWLTVAQIVLPAVLALVALVVMVVTVAGWPVVVKDNIDRALLRLHRPGEALSAAALALASLAFTLAGQRRIVSRPQPRSEPDLVAADEALRTSAVHAMGVTHLVLCLLLLAALSTAIGSNGPGDLTAMVLAITAFLVWGFRVQWPGTFGGPVAPPPFPQEEAAAVDVRSTSGPAWTAPRRPDAVAFAVIAVLAAGLWGLHWWGTLNPEVVASVEGATPVATGPTDPSPPFVNVVMRVENRSNSPIEWTALRIHTGMSGVPDRQAVPVASEGQPWFVAPGEIVRATIPVPLPPCSPTAALLPVGPYPSQIDVTSTWGRHLAISVGTFSPTSLGCEMALPGPDVPPADQEGAKAGISHAFETVYGGEPSDEKRTLVDHWDGLDKVTAQARATNMGGYVNTTRAQVVRVRYDRPDHAWVAYELHNGGNLVAVRRGEAVLVDGTWRITRSTICQDLALVGARCEN